MSAPEPMRDGLLDQLRADVAPDAIGASGQPLSPRHRVLAVALVRDAVAEIDRLRAHQPPPGLPDTITGPGDLDTVCSAAGLTRVADTDPDAGPHEWTGHLDVGLAHDDGMWSWTDRDGRIAEIEFRLAGSTAVLWAAIRAAREAT